MTRWAGERTAGIAAATGATCGSTAASAPEATIIVVKVTSDGAPAHDGSRRGTLLLEARVPVASISSRDKAREMRRPAVMLANFGHAERPDGRASLIARKIDDTTVGRGSPSRLRDGHGRRRRTAHRAGGTFRRRHRGDPIHEGTRRRSSSICGTPRGPLGVSTRLRGTFVRTRRPRRRDTHQTSSSPTITTPDPRALLRAQTGSARSTLQLTGPRERTITLTGTTARRAASTRPSTRPSSTTRRARTGS